MSQAFWLSFQMLLQSPINSSILRKKDSKDDFVMFFLRGKDDTIGPSSLSVKVFKFSYTSVVTFLTIYLREKKKQPHTTFTPILPATPVCGWLRK